MVARIVESTVTGEWRMGAGSTVTLLQSRVTGECRMGVGSTVTVTGVGLLAVGLYLVR